MADWAVWMAGAMVRELALFAAVGFLIGGLDDLLIDALWLAHAARRRWRARGRAGLGAGPGPSRRPGRIAVFVPAWDEGAVIGAMLACACRRWAGGDVAIYVGCYPNDPATGAAVAAAAARDPRVRPVPCSRAGPTTKADCLNHLWRALVADEAAHGRRAKAVVLHDAEDVVHAGELALFDRLIDDFAMVQLPVVPLVDRRSLWGRLVSGHYVDEFAEAHGKQLVVRGAVGAAVPSAGVGCAIARDAIQRIADAAGGAPFDPGSLTEDYEIGFKIAASRGRAIFVRRVADDGSLIAVAEHFPALLRDAVRQKARWMNGIALSGWDRIGWQGGIADRWMLLRDRRALIGAVVLSAAHVALGLWLAGLAAALAGFGSIDAGVPAWLILTNLGLLGWRVVVRAGFTAAGHGWRFAAGVPLRMLVANLIEMLAALHALGSYLRGRREGRVTWEKTAHRFPELGFGG